MSPRPPDPAVRLRLVEVAARLLAEHGPDAVTARRVASEAGRSTMAVYTHFGSMDELLAQIWTEGFRRFGAALDQPTTTRDPVADWMSQGWAYRHFALTEPHLYAVMFSRDSRDLGNVSAHDREAAAATFTALLDRIERCTAAGRWEIDDAAMAGELVWAAVHGHTVLELGGFSSPFPRPPGTVLAEMLVRLSIGFGDTADEARASLHRARTRARRAGQVA